MMLNHSWGSKAFTAFKHFTTFTRYKFRMVAFHLEVARVLKKLSAAAVMQNVLNFIVLEVNTC